MRPGMGRLWTWVWIFYGRLEWAEMGFASRVLL